MKILEKLLLVKEITIRLVVCYSIRLVVCLLSTLKIITKIIITVDLSKQQALDVDPKAIQQINFTANLDRAENTRIYFILEEAKETV